jgi:predicted MFS family arabinose efflux permease
LSEQTNSTRREREPPAIPTFELWTLRLGLLVTPHVFGSFNQAAVAAMAPVIKADLGFSYTDIGLIMAAYTATQAAFGIPCGVIADRLGIGFSLFFGFIMLGAAAFLFGHAGDLELCLIASAMMGCGYAFMNPSTAKAVFDWFPRNRRGTAASLKQTGVPVAWMIGALAFPLAELIDWRWILFGIAMLSAGTALVYLPMIEKPKPGEADSGGLMPFRDIWNIVKNRDILALEVNGFCYHAGQQNLYSFITLFMTEGLRAGSGLAAITLQLVQAGSIVGRIGLGTVSDFLLAGRRKPVLLTASCVSAIGVFALVILENSWGLYAALGLALVLGVFLCSGSPIYQTAVMEAVEPRLSGTAVGYHSTVLPAGKAVGTVFFGAVVDAFGFTWAWGVTAALIVIAAAVLFRFFRETAAKNGAPD